MSKVRAATIQDVDVLIGMGKQFLDYSEYGKFVHFDADELAKGLCFALDNGIVLVAENEIQIVGGIVGSISNLWFSPSTKVAVEMAWWVKPEYRGGRLAVKLLREFEKWGKSVGAKHIVMSDLVINGETPAGRLFEKLGYISVERSHMKGI